jgi:hypothetical protein
LANDASTVLTNCMPNKTSIEYVDYSSNPIYATYTFNDEITGEEKTKRGHHCVHWDTTCEGCYAEAWNLRFGTGLKFKAQNTKLIKFGLKVKELDDLIKLDRRLKQRNQWATCFLGDMTDVFQKGIPEYFLDETFKVLVTLERIIMYIFTKRADRLVAYTEKARLHHGPASLVLYLRWHPGESKGTS